MTTLNITITAQDGYAVREILSRLPAGIAGGGRDGGKTHYSRGYAEYRWGGSIEAPIDVRSAVTELAFAANEITLHQIENGGHHGLKAAHANIRRALVALRALPEEAAK